MIISQLDRLVSGMQIPFDGDRVTTVSESLAAEFRAGDMLLVSQLDGALLHVPAIVRAALAADVSEADQAFRAMSTVSKASVDYFFQAFAARLRDDQVWQVIMSANDRDLARARARGAATNRLTLTVGARTDMIAGLLTWACYDVGTQPVSEHRYTGWRLSVVRAPLGVIGFVFEGRPNVFADAVGVLRTGNVAVLKIGRDAHETAQAMMSEAVRPALEASGLPTAAVTLVDRPERAAAWALFADRRLSLAVARGSGAAVAQLGGIARQSGVPASLHGTGGAWLVADDTAEADRFASAVRNSLDRKVCNTLNVCCIVRSRAAQLVPLFLKMVGSVAPADLSARLHVAPGAEAFVPEAMFVSCNDAAPVPAGHILAFPLSQEGLSTEWEWDGAPELSLAIVDTVEDAVALFNTFSPRFVASLISESPDAHEAFYAQVRAPFVGDGYTRWVDGQFALGEPELGLSNWEHGAPLGRGAILSGGGIFTLRYRMHQQEKDLHR